MPKSILISGTLFVFVSCAVAQNPPKCGKGYQPLGERCVTQRMSDYIACVETSGGNRQEITEYVDQAASNQLSGQAKGAGNGMVVGGSGSLALSASSEKEVVKKIQQKWYSDGMKQCAKVLDAPPKKSASRELSDANRQKFAAILKTGGGKLVVFMAGTTDDIIPLAYQLCDSAQEAHWGWLCFESEKGLSLDNRLLLAKGIQCFTEDWNAAGASLFKKAANQVKLGCEYQDHDFPLYQRGIHFLHDDSGRAEITVVIGRPKS